MRKLHYLEGLRGVAAMIVVFHHLALLFCPELVKGGSEEGSLVRIISTTPLNLLYNGDFAVCLFFVLSGYVLSYKYVFLNDAQIVMGYAVKRYFRLMPLIASSVIFAALCIKAGWIHAGQLSVITGAGDWARDIFKDNPTGAELLENMFYGILLLGDNRFNPVVWSMQTEFIGSMLLFAFLLLSHRTRHKWPMGVALLVVAFYCRYYYYMAFILGYSLCYLNERRGVAPLPVAARLLLLLVAIFLSSFPATWMYWESSVYRFIYFGFSDIFFVYHIVGSVLLLLLIAGYQPAIDFLSSRPILFLGKISFPLYLLHLILLVLVAAPVFVFCFPYAGYFFSFLIALLVVLPLIFAVSFLANRFIDQPAISLSNSIERRFLAAIRKSR